MSFALDVDAKRRTVDFSVSAAAYREESVRIAAHIFDRKAEIYLAADKSSIDITLKAKRKDADPASLKHLAGEFLNELLNQEYRALVGGFNKKISNLITTVALYSARGTDRAPEKADEKSPGFIDDVECMLAEARAEIARTMPKKIGPQGPPIGPRPEDALA